MNRVILESNVMVHLGDIVACGRLVTHGGLRRKRWLAYSRNLDWNGVSAQGRTGSPGHQKTDIVVAHDTGTTESLKTQQNLSELVIKDRTDTLRIFSGPSAEDSTPAGTERKEPQGEDELYSILHRSSVYEESTRGRSQPDSLRAIPAAEFVVIGEYASSGWSDT